MKKSDIKKIAFRDKIRPENIPQHYQFCINISKKYVTLSRDLFQAKIGKNHFRLKALCIPSTSFSQTVNYRHTQPVSLYSKLNIVYGALCTACGSSAL